MKTIILTVFLCGLFIPSAFSQSSIKRIVNNYYFELTDKRHTNFSTKSDTEKLFFGDFNAPVEFSFLPSNERSRRPPSGLRIVRDSLNTSSILEVKYISNCKEAAEEAEKKAKEEQSRLLIDLPGEMLKSLPREFFNLIWEYNRNISDNSSRLERYDKELFKQFRIETLSFPVSDRFAEKMYEKMVSFIDNFKVKSTPEFILHGFSVVFRNVVEEEEWSLYIYMPEGNANEWTDLCLQIITDALAGKLDEAAYMAKLSTF